MFLKVFKKANKELALGKSCFTFLVVYFKINENDIIIWIDSFQDLSDNYQSQFNNSKYVCFLQGKIRSRRIRNSNLMLTS